MTKVDLTGVPETMLWPLWNRAYESARTDALIQDPWSSQLVEEIDYDFAASFGKPNRAHGIRSRVGDDLVTDFVQRHPQNACVVALGEGLETQYWRLAEPDIPWFSVDVAEAIEVRKRLLPKASAMSFLTYSALDLAWMEQIPSDKVPFISAMGLFMYFEELQVVDLLTAIAERFPGAEIFFDTIPPHFSAQTLKGLNITKSYRAPIMPWGISVDDLAAFIHSIPGLEPVKVQTYAGPFPWAMFPYNLLSKIGPIRRKFAPSLAHAKVAGKP